MLEDYIKYKKLTPELTLDSYINSFTEEELADIGLNKESLRDIILSITQCAQKAAVIDVKSITIKGGPFKDCTPEDIEITLVTCPITIVVGSTGSGQRSSWASISWLAYGI